METKSPFIHSHWVKWDRKIVIKENTVIRQGMARIGIVLGIPSIVQLHGWEGKKRNPRHEENSMKKMTNSNLQSSLAGESQAHIRYRNFADRARKDGFPNTGRLFEAAAASEQIHAGNHLRALDGIQETAANLSAAADGEDFEIEEMYPSYIAIAERQEEKKARQTMNNALQAERVHLDLYRRAAKEVSAGKDIERTEYYVCPLCGFTMEGNPPDVCPVCGTKHELFVKF
jgi:rubrerythrin